ncbi:MAG TPA: hypothetical protein VNO70_15420 [Blastocatellia bacterium]|nr:hypothetical protein [Blastocatellia bacterium]
MTTYTVIIKNAIINKEVMRIETDNLDLALSEAQHMSRRQGNASVYDNSSQAEIARFRYGVEEFRRTPEGTT